MVEKIKYLQLDHEAKRNALSKEMLRELIESVSGSRDRVIVLSGKGKGFCSGLDKDEIREELRNKGNAGEILSLLMDVCLALFQHPKPTVCVVHGFAIGGGLALARSCDYVMAQGEVEFEVPETEFAQLAEIVNPIINERLKQRDKETRETWVGHKGNTQESLTCGLIDKCLDNLPEKKLMDEVDKRLKTGQIKHRKLEAAEMDAIKSEWLQVYNKIVYKS